MMMSMYLDHMKLLLSLNDDRGLRRAERAGQAHVAATRMLE